MSAAPKTQRKVQQNKCISKLFSSMTKVHEVNRQHDHELSVRVEELRQKEHMENVRRYSDIRVLQRTLSEMRMEKNRLTHTFTPEEIYNDEVAPVMSWRKIQLKRFQNQPRKQRRKSDATQAPLVVAENAEFTAKNKFRSAIMAVCLSKALSHIPENNKKSESPGNESKQSEKEKIDSIKNLGERLKQVNDEKVATKQTPNKGDNVGDTKHETEERGQSRPETSETERLSRVLDILRNSSRDKSRSSWTRSLDKKVNAVPTFGQLHPVRRSSLVRRPGDPPRRRPSTSDMNFDSSHFVMDKDGTIRRIPRPTVKDNTNTEESRGSRVQSSSYLSTCSRKATPKSCKVYAAEPSRRWNVSNDASGSKSGSAPSFLVKKRSELLKRDKEMMDRLRSFLDSTLP